VAEKMAEDSKAAAEDSKVDDGKKSK